LTLPMPADSTALRGSDGPDNDGPGTTGP
jgi:hypothetical protein